PANLFVAQFIGSPAMNILPGTLKATGSKSKVALGDREVSVPVETPDSQQGKPVHFGVRPEDLVPTQKKGIISGEITHVEQLGEVTNAFVDTGLMDEPLVVKLPGNHAFTRHEMISLDADPAKLHLFNEGGRSFLFV
ncbi:MAG: TOBE domain-containing protein, partial [Nitratireductor sp.]|nr:TOBE domain-containing protein [Nitratireductor sp.]